MTGRIQSFKQLDGGYLVSRTSASGAGGDKSQANRGPLNTDDYWVVKTDASGNKLWDKRFGTADDDLCCVALQTADGGFILGGYSSGTLNGDRSVSSRGTYDYWLVKTDASGTKQWDKRYGGTDIDYLFDMKITSDGGFILGGTSYSSNTGDKTQSSRGNEDYWIIKTDGSGNMQWDKTMGGTGSDWLNHISQTADGYYIIGGWSDSGISGEKTQTDVGISDYWLIKLGPPGSLPVELISFTAKMQSASVILEWKTASEINNSGFALERAEGEMDFKTIAWINGNGNTSFTSSYSYEDKSAETNHTYYYRLKQTDFDGKENLSEVLAVKFIGHNENFYLSKNIFTGEYFLSYNLSEGSDVNISLLDVSGKQNLLLRQSETAGDHQLSFSKNNLRIISGVYFLNIETPFYRGAQKIIIE